MHQLALGLRVRTFGIALIGLMACGPAGNSTTGGKDGGGGGADAGLISGLTSVEVAPGAVTLIVMNGTAATQTFVATGHFMDGHSSDISALCSWTLSNSTLGQIPGGHFTSAVDRGGISMVTAACGAQAGMADLTLMYQAERISTEDGSTAPADSATRFTSTVTDTGLAPTMVYPLDGTLVPRNLGELEVQWRKPTKPADLFQIEVQGTSIDLKVYSNAVKPAGGFFNFTPGEWTAMANSAAGDTLAITVRAVNSSDTSKIGVGTPIQFSIGKDVVNGGIYYWSSSNTATEGIIRHKFGDTSSMATPFYTKVDDTMVFGDNTGHCVACHALSRDGKKMAITYDGGDNSAAVVDVMTKTLVFPRDTTGWNFASMSPDGKKMVVVHQGVVTIRDLSGTATNNQVLATIAIPGGGRGSHPDWSPDGTRIAFVKTGNVASDWDFSGGSIYVTTDSGSGFGAATPLVMSAGENNYYPTFSPDNEWILFNRAQGTAYNNGGAEVWVVKATGGTPIKLAAANVAANQTNSWPRWSPFVQNNGPHGKLLYFTYSSQRDYGIELILANRPQVGNPLHPDTRPQVWMSAFDPSVAATGGDPSIVPFWLPFQDRDTNNHIAQWATQIVGIN